MTKIALEDFATLSETATVLRLNSNNAEIETKSDTFLSRVGTSPNQMEADLDMNSNRIYNLPKAFQTTEPVRYGEFIGALADDGTQALIDALNNATMDTRAFETRATAQAATINAAIDVIETRGYSLPGDGGGGTYKRVAVEPSHGAKLQSADGAWWELSESIYVPEQVGAKGDNSTDDTAALNILGGLGVHIKLPYNKTYKTTGTVFLESGTYLEGPGSIHFTVVGNDVALDATDKSNVTLDGVHLHSDNTPGTFTSQHYGFFAQSVLTLATDPATLVWSDNIRIVNCHMHGFGDSLIRGGFWRNACIDNNSLGDSGFCHIQIGSIEHSTINSNRCQDLSPGLDNGVGAPRGGVSIFVSRSGATSPMLLKNDAPPPRHLSISNNVIIDCPALVGIDCHAGEYITMSGNVLHNVQRGVNIEQNVTRGTTGTDPGPTTTRVHLGAGAIEKNDYYNTHTIAFTSGALTGEESVIQDYDGTTKIATVAPAFSAAPAAGVTFDILEANTDSSFLGRGVICHSINIIGNNFRGVAASSACDYGIAIDTGTHATALEALDEVTTGINVIGNTLRHYGQPDSGGSFSSSFRGAAIVVRNCWQGIISNNSFPLTYGRVICVGSTFDKVYNLKVTGNTITNVTTHATAGNTFLDLFGPNSSVYCNENHMNSNDTTMFRSVAPSGATTGIFLSEGNVALGTNASLINGSSQNIRRTYREGLTTSRTYYVRSDGNDQNDGLVNSAARAFLTVARAMTEVSTYIDVAGQGVVVQLADGTYTTQINLPDVPLRGGQLVLQGNTGTPANCLISTTSANAINASGSWSVVGFKIETTTTGHCISMGPGGSVVLNAINFGATPSGWSHINQQNNKTAVTMAGPWEISGGAGTHLNTGFNGTFVKSGSHTCTLTGTPAFGTAFSAAGRGSIQLWTGTTFSGGATGKRYDVVSNAVIDGTGGVATFFPGDVAGTTATGGQYL